MDIKNACNSFLNGMQVAEALIQTGQYSKALVVSGEIPSRTVRWKIRDFNELKSSFLGYTFGDAGAAVVLERSDDERGICLPPLRFGEQALAGVHRSGWRDSSRLRGGILLLPWGRSRPARGFRGVGAGRGLEVA